MAKSTRPPGPRAHQGALLEEIRDQVRLIAEGHGVVIDRLDRIEGDVGAIKGHLQSLDGRVGRLEGDVGAIKEHLQALDGRVERIEDHLDLNGAPARPRRATAPR